MSWYKRGQFELSPTTLWLYNNHGVARDTNSRRKFVSVIQIQTIRLILNVIAGNIVNELEKNLNMIEEIYGYLKVVRSFPLISLNFLKNLRVIHGNTLESDKYAFVVLDNQNLQELWDWKGRSLAIKRGKLFFHFNPKLCMSVIDQLQNITNLPNYTEHEVASSSNGDKTACK